MPVSDRIREIEKELDTSIRSLPTWQAPQAEVLEQLMGVYRNAIEDAFVKLLP